ncbi:hypothetical protein FRX31_018943 [Thalictrum thalictroides]|uniref:Uncharacterized protein n=1 Tax=Thalictrum thalictroides TaxID=46969 RepID=A0A7J6W3E4_THATH|nr:hypothetical protein FRX31_018943 [Thalictrum thalictroides]
MDLGHCQCKLLRNSKRIEDEPSSLKKAKRFSEEHSSGSSGSDKMKVKFGFVIKGIFKVCSLRDLNCIFETSEKIGEPIELVFIVENDTSTKKVIEALMEKKIPFMLVNNEVIVVNKVEELHDISLKHVFVPRGTEDWSSYHIPHAYNAGTQATAVASSGSLMCFLTSVVERRITVNNPLNQRPCASVQFSINDTLRGIAIHGTKTCFVVLEKSFCTLAMEIYSSKDRSWKTLILQKQIIDSSEELVQSDINPEVGIPSKQYTGFTTIDSNGTLDVVIMFVLREIVMENGVYLDETHMVLHLSEFDEERKKWKCVAVMPSEYCDHYFFSADDLDMSCCGIGNYIMLCFSSDEEDLYDVVTYDIVEDIWDYVPPCVDRHTRETKQFVAAYPILLDFGEERDG